MANKSRGLGTLTPIRDTRTLQDQVYLSIRDLVASGRFEPGTFIREQEICNQIEVSRTPVRESLGRLATEGFLERIPQRGYRVPEITIEQLLELYPIVSALESLAGKVAFRNLTPAELDKLRRLNACFREAVQRDNVEEMVTCNNRFHNTLVEPCENQRLLKMLDDLRSQLIRLEHWYYSNLEHARESLLEHDDLIAALETGDSEHALEIFETNWALTFDAFKKEVQEEEEIESIR